MTLKMHNKLVDDNGVEWEFLYIEDWYREAHDDPHTHRTRVRDFKYRVLGNDNPWLELPSWADVAEEWKINLCLFDENEASGEMTFWPVVS